MYYFEFKLIANAHFVAVTFPRMLDICLDELKESMKQLILIKVGQCLSNPPLRFTFCHVIRRLLKDILRNELFLKPFRYVLERLL